MNHSQSSNSIRPFFHYPVAHLNRHWYNTMPSSAITMRFLLLTLVCARLSNAVVGPNPLWSQPLPNGGTIEGEGLRKGNAVVLSDDEQSLWVTAESGSLHVYDSAGGTRLASFHPEAIDGHYTGSHSSVSLYQPNESIEFAVYAVVDVSDHHGGDSLPTMMSGGISRYVCACDNRLLSSIVFLWHCSRVLRLYG